MKKTYMLTLSSIILFAGCSASNWNLGKTMTNDIPQAKQEQPKTIKEKNAENFHIDTVINTWGEPTSTRVNSAGNKVYVWENCKPTGNFIESCNENGCETIPEKECCERDLITDEAGYVQNIKEAVNSCI